MGFPLDGQGCGTWFSPCSCDETCPVWPGSWVLQEEGGQGKVTATRPASGCGVLTFHHTLGLPRSDSSPVRCRAQDRPHRPLSQVAGEELRHSLKTGCECLVLCSGPETGSGSGKVGPRSCTVSFLRAPLAAEELRLLWRSRWRRQDRPASEGSDLAVPLRVLAGRAQSSAPPPPQFSPAPSGSAPPPA